MANFFSQTVLVWTGPEGGPWGENASENAGFDGDENITFAEVGNPNGEFSVGEEVLATGGVLPAEGVTLYFVGYNVDTEFDNFQTPAFADDPDLSKATTIVAATYDSTPEDFEEDDTPVDITQDDVTEQQSYTLCFGVGTLIATPEGERPVETLAIGDLVRTADGRDVPVKWMGKQTALTPFGPAERLRPVRIAAGALAENVPHTDLEVTPDHGMVIDGVVAHASALVNGSTVTRPGGLPERLVFWHIETDAHDVVLANGAPAETFIDNVSRRRFDNYAEFVALYGDDVEEMIELDMPRAMSARQLPAAIADALAARARVLAEAARDAA